MGLECAKVLKWLVIVYLDYCPKPWFMVEMVA